MEKSFEWNPAQRVGSVDEHLPRARSLRILRRILSRIFGSSEKDFAHRDFGRMLRLLLPPPLELAVRPLARTHAAHDGRGS